MKKEDKKEINKSEEKEIIEKKKRPLVSYIILLILVVFLIYTYARYQGTKGLKVREYNIINENIPSSFDGFSIAHFSDLELGSTTTLEEIDSMVSKINELKPDIVVFTGDTAKRNYKVSEDEKKKLIDILSKIDPLIGKYSVRGDDDYSGSLYDEAVLKSGFEDITNSYELIYYKGLTPIVLYGLGSLINGDQDYEGAFSYPNEEEDTAYMATYRILLAHEPDTLESVESYNISLMLSGHSHNSELNIPYIKNYYNIKGASTYFDKEYIVNGTELYVSSGIGTSRFKVRLFSKPSISIYRLYTD